MHNRIYQFANSINKETLSKLWTTPVDEVLYVQQQSKHSVTVVN